MYTTLPIEIKRIYNLPPGFIKPNLSDGPYYKIDNSYILDRRQIPVGLDISKPNIAAYYTKK